MSDWRKGRICRYCGTIMQLNDPPHDCLKVLADRQHKINEQRARLAHAEKTADRNMRRDAEIKLRQLGAELEATS